jgi:hypothetical protein
MEFGECQILLMNYMVGKKGSKSVLQTSVEIIILYYKKFQYEILQFLLEKFGNDLSLPLINLAYNGIRSNMKIHQEDVAIVDQEINLLKGLKMIPFEEFPNSLKPNHLKNEWNIKFNEEEEEIFKKFSSFSIPNSTEIIKEKLNQLPMLVYYSKKTQNSDYSKKNQNSDKMEGFIFIIRKNGGKLSKKEMRRRLEKLIVILKACYIQLEEFLAGEVSELEAKDQRRNFFHWINKIFLTQEEEKLPLFGKFTLPGVKCFDHNSITIGPQDFSDAQHSLIDFFSCPDYASKIVHLSLGLILSWYSIQQDHIFHQKFTDEIKYWERMNKILVEKLTERSSFSSKKLINFLSR